VSKSEILAELPHLSEEDRAEILEQLWSLAGASGPTDREKTLLDEAQSNCDSDSSSGEPWSPEEARLRARG
jgi:hypothetical protein